MYFLPIEILLKILAELPPSEAGARALARCGMTGRNALREASTDPALWSSLYEHRYTHADASRESERTIMLAGNRRLMYYERRRLDHKAIEHLQVVSKTTLTQTRVEHARAIAALGRDVWDVLKLEAARPPPDLFQDEKDIEKVKEGSPPADLARKHWASELLNIIARRDALERWSSLNAYSRGQRDDLLSFEEAFASLSSFYGVISDEILCEINRLADMCKAYLERQDVSYVPGTEGFDTRKMCIAICAFMRSQGFVRGPPDRFYDIRNSIPHLFLSSQRRSLPISLVFIFVAIAKRLGLQATALNTRNCVIALVRGTFVNVYDAEILSMSEEFSDDTFAGPSQAELTISLLNRVTRNIYAASIQAEAADATLVDTFNPSERHYYARVHALYMADCLSTIIGTAVSDSFFHRVVSEPFLFPLDLELVIRDRLIPNSLINLRSVTEYFCNESKQRIERSEEEAAATVPVKSRTGADRLFVGQLIIFSRDGRLGCVAGWEAGPLKDVYTTISAQHHHVGTFQLEEIIPVNSCTASVFRNFLANLIVGQFFKDAEFFEASEASGAGRGRLIMNDRLAQLYMEDDAYGARWVRGYEQ